MSSYYTYEGNLRDRNKFTSTVNTSFGMKRYFSSLDTEVYFGAQQVDEIVAFDFTIAEPKLPIYGFNSFYANRIVSGRRTIQGTFAINFTGVFYLLNILNAIDDSVLKATYTAPGSDTAIDYESLVGRCEGDDSTGLGIGNSAVFRKIFDITLSYGYGKSDNKTYNGCYQTLVGVQIVDYRQALDTEGNPILDMYSFIAKDLRYSDALADESAPAPEDGTTTDPNAGGGTDPEEEPVPETDHIVANKQLENEMQELNNTCQNSNVSGFIINPTFNYTPSGQHSTSSNPYIRLTIESLNNTTENFTNVSIFLSDQLNGINTTIELKDVKNGSAQGTIYEFEGSMRETGNDLAHFHSIDESYRAQCVVEFTAMINDKEESISHATLLNVGSTLK